MVDRIISIQAPEDQIWSVWLAAHSARPASHAPQSSREPGSRGIAESIIFSELGPSEHKKNTGTSRETTRCFPRAHHKIPSPLPLSCLPYHSPLTFRDTTTSIGGRKIWTASISGRKIWPMTIRRHLITISSMAVSLKPTESVCTGK